MTIYLTICLQDSCISANFVVFHFTQIIDKTTKPDVENLLRNKETGIRYPRLIFKGEVWEYIPLFKTDFFIT